MRFFAAVFLSVLLSIVSASAQDAETADPTLRGPAIGQGFAFVEPMTAHDGRVMLLKDIHGPNGTAIFFNRSLSWCPFCKNQTQDVIDNAAMLTEAGFAIAVVTYDAPAALKTYADGAKPSFPLLSDASSQTIKAYGLLNKDYEPGSFAYGIPHPMILVVGPDNVVKAKFAEEGYKVRPVLAEVVASLTASE